MDYSRLLAERTRKVEFSGIRKFFELAGKLKDPCDLSIGQPDYDAPEALKSAAIAAIRRGDNRYTPSAGVESLRERIVSEWKHVAGVEPAVLVTSGVSGGLTLALLAVVDPGDEVVFCDPYFVSYLHLVHLVGGRPVPVPCYPDFAFRGKAVEAAITPRTKAIIVNSPANPTGRVMGAAEMREACAIARRHGLLLISDEIYDRLCYDEPSPCPLPQAADCALVLRGFGKTFGVTGWRMGYAVGPAPVIAEMTKLHQYTYVCAPSMAQAALAEQYALEVSDHREAYRKKRDLVCDWLGPKFEFVRPTGGFYVFPKAPVRFGSATAFCEAASERGVLVIPGCVFSGQDTHFRLSYAASDEKLRRGCEVLCRLATG
jgi:aspartate/methionine/tyrosine aminotransferase